jgi:hypothetical protein
VVRELVSLNWLADWLALVDWGDDEDVVSVVSSWARAATARHSKQSQLSCICWAMTCRRIFLFYTKQLLSVSGRGWLVDCSRAYLRSRTLHTTRKCSLAPVFSNFSSFC